MKVSPKPAPADELLAEIENNSSTVEGQAPAKPTESNSKGSQATKLVRLVFECCTLFHDSDDKAYATFKVKANVQNWPVRSSWFKKWMSRAFFEIHGKTPNSQAIQDAMNTVEGEAVFSKPEKSVHHRVASAGDKIYLDLANDKWEAVEIGKGYWKVVSAPPVVFCRSSSMLPLPTPETGGSLNELDRFINVADSDSLLLIKAFLVFAIDPDGPFPVLAISGPQGSAKSTATKYIKDLIDPTKAGLRSVPKSEDDLLVAAQHSWMVSFDNLSEIKPWLSDSLCRMATGAGLAKRELYTNSEEIVLEAKRPIAFNGIGHLISRPDLMDRAVPVILKPIGDGGYKTESDIDDEFQQARPRLLGSILDAVAAGLANEDGLVLDRTPRMADFAKRIEAASPALGLAPGEFTRIFNARRKTYRVELALGDAVCVAIANLLECELETELKTTAAGLLDKLNSRVVGHKPRDWPESPRALSNKISRLEPVLLDLGITVQFKRTGKGRWIELRTVKS